MSEHLDHVTSVVRDALHARYHMNADPYEDDPHLFGVAFPDGSMIDVLITDDGGVIAARDARIRELEAALRLRDELIRELVGDELLDSDQIAERYGIDRALLGEGEPNG